MKRFTKKVDKYYCSQDNEKSLKPLYDKLGQIEDLEEKSCIDSITLLKVMTDGIYYYDRYGKVSSFTRPSVSDTKISQFKNGRNCSFYWRDLGVKFWLTEEEAKENAQEYLNCFSEKLTISKLKEICKMSEESEFYIKKDNQVRKYSSDYLYYDKMQKALICCHSYYNGLYDSSYEELFPIQEYGINWALTKEELEDYYD